MHAAQYNQRLLRKADARARPVRRALCRGTASRCARIGSLDGGTAAIHNRVDSGAGRGGPILFRSRHAVRADARGGERGRQARSRVAHQIDDGVSGVWGNAVKGDYAIADGDGVAEGVARRGLADVHRAAQGRQRRRARARHDRAIGQRRIDRAGRACRGQRGSVRRKDEPRSGAPRPRRNALRQRHGHFGSAALLDGNRHCAARCRADPRLSRVLPHLFAEGVSLQQHHAAESQSIAVDRPVRRRRQDRAY